MYPVDDEVFELTLDGDAPENQPLEMIISYLVRSKCYESLRGTEHQGPTVRGCKTSRFKLVRIGHCYIFGDVRRKLIAHGEIPEGQWIRALMVAYPSTGCPKGPIGIADDSWHIPFGGSFFPAINDFDGKLFFERTHTNNYIDFNERWRWLVEVKKEEANENDEQ